MRWKLSASSALVLGAVSALIAGGLVTSPAPAATASHGAPGLHDEPAGKGAPFPENWPDPAPYGAADARAEISARPDNSQILDLELRPQDAPQGRVWMRDTYVNKFEVDGATLWVATGTTRAAGLEKAAPWNDGIYVWTAPSQDGPWSLVDTAGLRPDQPTGKVWSPEFVDENSSDRTVVAGWQTYKNPDDPAARAGQVWAPEIHYIDEKWYIVACMGGQSRLTGSFILESDGGPEGPYHNIDGSVAKPLGDPVSPTNPQKYHIDGGLFDDGDATYLVLHNDLYSEMKPDMSGLETPTNLPRFEQEKYAPEPYLEGATVTKYRGKYYLMHAAWSRRSTTDPASRWSYLPGNGTKGQYDAIVAVADSFKGPYSARYTLGVGVGHNNFFIDENGRPWATFFRNPNFGYWSDPARIGDAAVAGVVQLEWTGPHGDRLYVKRPSSAQRSQSAVSPR